LVLCSRFFAFGESPDLTADEAPDNSDTLGTSLFVSCVDLHTDVSKKFYVRALAKVDQGWRKQAENGEDLPSPHIPPQSHYVNARTNAKWNHQWNGRDVKGLLWWYSPTIEVTIEAAAVSPNATAASANATVANAPPTDTITAPPATTLPAPPTTTLPSKAPAVTPSADDDDEMDEGDDNIDDDDVGVEPVVPTPTTTTPATPATPKPSITATPPPSVDEKGPLDGVLKTDTKAKSTESSSLLSYGYLTLGVGGLVIVLTVAYMYKRIFRSHRRAYMNINQQRPQRSPFGRRGPTSPRHRDEDGDDDEP
jgi:hypothetical protein